MDTLMGGLKTRTKKLLLTVIASRLYNYNLQHILSFGKLLRTYYTKFVYKIQMAENNHSGKVKVNRIGKPACLRASETERMWGFIKSLRYSPCFQGNLRVVQCLFQLENRYRFIDLLYTIFYNHFLIIHNKNELTSN